MERGRGREREGERERREKQNTTLGFRTSKNSAEPYFPSRWSDVINDKEDEVCAKERERERVGEREKKKEGDAKEKEEERKREEKVHERKK